MTKKGERKLQRFHFLNINSTQFTLLFSFQVARQSEQRPLPTRRSITVRPTSCLVGLDLMKQVKLFYIQHRKSTESKQNKQEVSQTVILPLKLVFSGLWVAIDKRLHLRTPSVVFCCPKFESQASHPFFFLDLFGLFDRCYQFPKYWKIKEMWSSFVTIVYRVSRQYNLK